MALFGGLLKTLTGVTHWVRSGVRRALTPEQIVDAVDPDEGLLDQDQWEQVIGDFVEQQHVWGKIKGIPRECTIPEQFSMPNPENTYRKYRYDAFVNVKSLETGEVWDRWIACESDHLLTRAEVDAALEENLMLTPGSEGDRLINVNDYEFWVRPGEREAF
jgi:hypothetical protein